MTASQDKQQTARPLQPRDILEDQDQAFLGKLHLAVSVLLELAGDPGILNSAMEADLLLFKERLECALPAADGDGQAGHGR